MLSENHLHAVVDYLNMDNDPQDIKTQKTIEIINGRVLTLGYSSRKLIGQDNLDLIVYPETNDDDLVTEIVEGSMTLNMEYPYNDIIYNKKINEWRMFCAQIYFRTHYNLIPNETLTKTTFPKFINIRRSNGNIVKARIKKKAGFRISKASVEEDAIPTNRVPKLYLRVEFSSSDTNLEDYSIPQDYYKDIPFSNICEYNPEIKDFEITFSLPNNVYDDYRNGVINYYCELHNKWCDELLYPLVKYIKTKYDINIKINTHII